MSTATSRMPSVASLLAQGSNGLLEIAVSGRIGRGTRR